MVGQVGLRILLLLVAPGLALFLGDRLLLLLTLSTSALATVLDLYRQRKRILPFPNFLLLVYALQSSCAVFAQFVPHGGMAVPAMNTLIQMGGVQLAMPDHDAGEQRQPGSKAIRTMSIVIAAYNEHAYMKRTLDSIYERTPKSILREIIIVDDASSPPLADGLKEYKDVRIMRNEKRLGLIKSKTLGGNAASSDMIMFLDGHVKPDKNWAEPLLKHMNINYRRVVVPLIPILDKDTWEINNNAVGVKMMFDWTLFFQWFEDWNDLVPCMSGGLFGITRQWWHESGEYDYAMSMWGAENIEQSIRIWLCGGEIYVARDSRVGHVFRSKFPYAINNTEIYLNKVRTVETWFDEYKSKFYSADRAAVQFVRHIGNLSEREALKKKLHCKPFQWYVDKFRSVFVMKQMLPVDYFQLKDRSTQLCLAATSDNRLEEKPCEGHLKSTLWSHSAEGNWGFRNAATDKCIDANAGVSDKTGMPVILYFCFPKNDMQLWSLMDGHMRWLDFCMQGASTGSVKLASCSSFLANMGKFDKLPRGSSS